jgi:hypothetical protein
LTPGSAAFSGAGNVAPVAPVVAVKAKARPLTRAQKLQRALKACRVKHDRRKRVACEVQARKKYGPPHRPVKKTSHGPKR